MSYIDVGTAFLMTAAAAFSLGCCCPARFAPAVLPPPPIVIEPPQEDQAQIARKKAAEALQQQIAQNLGPNNHAGSFAPNSPLWAKIRQAAIQRRYTTNPAIGGAFADTAFTDTLPQGGVLIGFFAGEDDGGLIGFLQPIYLTATGEKVGTAYGAVRRPVQFLKAKTGYALGGVNLRAGGVIDALTLTFMKVAGERLNPADSYASATLGGQGGGPMNTTANGALVIGLHGKCGQNDGFVPAGAIVTLGLLSLP